MSQPAPYAFPQKSVREAHLLRLREALLAKIHEIAAQIEIRIQLTLQNSEKVPSDRQPKQPEK
jgi:hypothetical protein